MKKRVSQGVKTFLAVAFVTLFGIIIAFPQVAAADANNIFVEDNAGILTAQDKESIKQMNEERFANLPGKPQYAVVTLKNLDGYDSIEDYATKKFEQMGIGDKELDNGFLFVIAVDDHKYRLETGYGVEDVITDSMKEKVVTGQATELLQDDQYGQAVMLVSKNIESLVTEKYSDIDAAKEIVAKEKEREAKMMKTIFNIILGAIGLVLLLFLIYRAGLSKMRATISKKYLNRNVDGYVYVDNTSSLINFGNVQGIRQVNLSKYLAKTLYYSPSKKRILSSDEQMINWLSQYLLEDSLIQYWRNSKEEAPYDISVYLEDKYFKDLKQELLPRASSFSYPLSSNPYLESDAMFEITQYVVTTREKHKENLRISKENKRYVETLSERYLEENNVRLRKLDYELEVALMVYYFLQEQDLSDPLLLRKIQITPQSLRSAYRFAEKRRRQMANEQKRQALNDLTNMTLGSYYMQAMIWSSYHNNNNSGSGFGGGGGSSFGGGSSGGGGFSGGW